MGAGAEPRFRPEWELEIGDVFDGDETAIGDAPRETRRVVAEQRGADGRIDPVSANDDVCHDPHAILEPCLSGVALVDEADQPVTELNPLGRQYGRDDREQIGAMNGQMRRAVELFAAWIERRVL